jgi:hypothetical protein
MFARMESDALANGSALKLLLTLAIVFAILRIISMKRTRLPSVQFDEAPATFQRLGLDM